MSSWLKVCTIEEIPPLGARVVRHGDIDIAVFRTADDAVFAVRDRCPHKGGPLSQGIVHGNSVTCPLHGWNLELSTGCAAAPDEGCAQKYDTRLDAGVVHLALTREYCAPSEDLS